MAATMRTTHSGLLAELKITLPLLRTPPRPPSSTFTMYNSYEQAMVKVLDHCANLKAQLEEERTVRLETETHLKKLVSIFEQMVNDKSADTVFEVNGDLIRAHSTVVSLWSAPIGRMLQLNMREGLNQRIVITTEELPIVREMVKYFYTVSADINKNTALPLLRLASLYQIESLRDQCCAFLKANIDAENCISVLHLANLHLSERIPKWKELYDVCIAYFQVNHMAVLSSDLSPFSGFDFPLLATLLREIANIEVLPNQRIDSIKLVGNAIVNWAKDNWPIGDMTELLTYINAELARGRVQLFVKVCGKNTLVIFISNTKTVYELKQVIEGKEAIPTEFQVLHFNGRTLNDGVSLNECNIQNDSTLQLFVHSHQGPKPTHKPPVEDYTSSLRMVYEMCLNAIVADFGEQCKCHGFLKLDSGTIAHILQQDDLAVPNEGVVLDAVVSWLADKPESVKNDTLSRLLSLVRFPYIDTRSLLNIPITHPTIGSCDILKTLLQEALHFQISKLLGTGAVEPLSTTTNPTHPQQGEQSSYHPTHEHTLQSTTALRSKRRRLYTALPTVNLDQFISYVATNAVRYPWAVDQQK